MELLMDLKAFYCASVVVHVLGILCLVFIIPTFLFWKVLRSHPGTIILTCCLIELAYCYGGLIIGLVNLYYMQLIDFNIIKFYDDLIQIFSFRKLNLTDSYLQIYLHSSYWLMLFMLDLYYICLSIDIILILRNPFYSPVRRLKIYNLFSLSLPILYFLTSKIYIYIYII